MKLASTIIALILAALGVGGMMYVGWDPVELTGRRAETRRLLSGSQLPVDDVNRITLKRAGETTLVFARTANGWRQVEPFEYPMDPFSIRQLAAAAREVEVVDVIEPGELRGGQSLSSLELEPAAAEIKYEWPAPGARAGGGAGSGAGSLKLELGRRSVAGRAYARIAGDLSIFIVDQALHERALGMNPQEWRDRTILPAVSIDARQIGWEEPGASKLTLVRERRAWRMLEPVQTRVDAVGRDAWLQDLGRAVVAGFIMDFPGGAPAAELAKFGLSTPVATLTIVNEAPSGQADAVVEPASTQRLFLGSRTGANTSDRYAMIEGRPVVVKLSGAVVEALFRQPIDLIDPTGSGVQPADVKTIMIRSAASDVTLERDLEKWRMVDGIAGSGGIGEAEGGRVVNAGMVEALLDQLTQLRAPKVELMEYPRELEVATVTFLGFDARALDTIRIVRHKDTGSWGMENGDSVLRVFPASLDLKLSASDY